MERRDNNIEDGQTAPHCSTWRRLAAAARNASRSRPFSFYLLCATVVMLLVGTPIVHFRTNPRKLAAFLVLNLAFFLVVIVCALKDCVDIVLQGYREGKEIFRSTLGDQKFAAELRRRVDEKRMK